jgi:hypothetical protein
MDGSLMRDWVFVGKPGPDGISPRGWVKYEYLTACPQKGPPEPIAIMSRPPEAVRHEGNGVISSGVVDLAPVEIVVAFLGLGKAEHHEGIARSIKNVVVLFEYFTIPAMVQVKFFPEVRQIMEDLKASGLHAV